MKKLKIYVYAICKNEQNFVKRWANSMSQADGIFVLDTGSTDDTVKLLKECGVIVNTAQITPWRFDVARNKSLEFVPNDADICICTDLDEVFEDDWREKFEKSWQQDTDSASYRYTWNFNPDGSEGCVFYIEKAHTRKNFVWENPVHEVLKYLGQTLKKSVLVEGAKLNHYADSSKPRSQYLPLLELAARENPNNERNIHYLGREYMFYNQWEKCIDTLKTYLLMPTATWEDERAASMRYIAASYAQLNKPSQAFVWFNKAIAEAAHLREPYCDFAQFLLGQSNWHGVIFMCDCALSIKNRAFSYINQADAWGFLPYDLTSIAYYNLKNYDKALEYGKKALDIAPYIERLQTNYNFCLEKAQNTASC